jgi:hypothetical protein
MTDVVIKGFGPNSSVEAQVDPTHSATRFNLRPLEHVTATVIGGHYFLSAVFSSTAAALLANSDIFSMRWADTSRKHILKSATIWVATTTVFTNAQLLDYGIFRASTFTTNPSSGTDLSVSLGSGNRARTIGMTPSALASSGALQISSGGPLTPGTRTLDTQPFGTCAPLLQSAAAANAIQLVAPGHGVLYQLRNFGMHPLAFETTEGFVIQNLTAHGAAGVVKHGISLEWAEVGVY